MIADWLKNAVVKSLILKGISIVILLGGCAQQSLAPDSGLIFSAAGKLALRDADSGYTANFSWDHYDDRDVVAVWGPLGQGRTELSSTADRMRVHSGGKLIAEGAPQDLLDEYLQWSVPLPVLSAWLQGRPAAGWPVEALETDAQGRGVRFVQAGWQVSLQRSGAATGSLPAGVPVKINAVAGPVTVKVVVRQFQRGNPTAS